MEKLREIEFYTFESEVWYRVQNGANEQLTEDSKDMVSLIINHISEMYPQAYKALSEHYQNLSWNKKLQNYRIARQFCKCNFGNIDNIDSDIDYKGSLHFEHISCPMRGECKMENVVCHPEFNSELSKAEKRVVSLLFKGEETEKIASVLCISHHTVKNHLKNVFTKLGINSRSELIDYCHRNKIFK